MQFTEKRMLRAMVETVQWQEKKVDMRGNAYFILITVDVILLSLDMFYCGFYSFRRLNFFLIFQKM